MGPDICQSRGRRYDFFFLLTLLLLNPVLWFLFKSSRIVMPDTVAYIKMGSELINHGKLYLGQWGHVDGGMILPPFYPFLIGVGRRFLDEGVVVAELISSVCIILAVFPLYFFVKSLSSRVVAFLAILLIQSNILYVYFGLLPLTEATFLFVLSVGLFQCQRTIFINKKVMRRSLFLGVVTATIMLTRSLGGAFLVTILLLFLFKAFLGGQHEKAHLKKALGWFCAGFFLLYLPYSVALYGQTGKTFLTQQFRFGKYVIVASPSDMPAGLDMDNADYREIFEYRRDVQRVLLPDSSEMFGFVVKEQSNRLEDCFLPLLQHLTKTGIFLNNLVENIHLIDKGMGRPLKYAFFLSLLSFSFFYVRGKITDGKEILPIFFVSYLFVVSIFTGAIERYVQVLFFFIIAQVMVESWRILRLLFKNNTRIRTLVILVIFTGAYFFTPAYSIQARIQPKFREPAPLFSKCSEYVMENDPVFAFHPLPAYLLGGSYRILPNDSLDKIACYAQKTGVNWLVLTNSPGLKLERSSYSKSAWLKNQDSLADLFPQQVALRCQEKNGLFLYEFKQTGFMK